MNRAAMGFVFLAVSLILGALSLAFIEVGCNSLIEDVEYTLECVAENDPQKSSEAFTVTVDKWEAYKPVLNLLLGQGETIEIRADLNKAIFYMNSGDFETSILHLQECKADLNRIISSNEPNITTIF